MGETVKDMPINDGVADRCWPWPLLWARYLRARCGPTPANGDCYLDSYRRTDCEYRRHTFPYGYIPLFGNTYPHASSDIYATRYPKPRPYDNPHC